MTHQEAVDLLYEYTKSESLRNHARAVEAAMRAYARSTGGNEDLWAIAGLLHDFDYEVHPEFPDHPLKGSEILMDHGCPEEVRTAILGHVPATNVPRAAPMAKILFACDELCGFIVACALVRPNKLGDLEARSVRKKMKDKAFARAVRREDIVQGAEEAGLALDDHIQVVIDALKPIAKEIGL